MTEEISFFAIFCDDIRHEFGNKYSLMGCYGNEITLPKLPSKIGRLCAHFSIVSDSAENLVGKSVKVSVLIDGKPTNTMSFDIDRGSLINGGMDLVSLELREKMTLQMLARIGDQDYFGPKLTVTKPRPQPSPPN